MAQILLKSNTHISSTLNAMDHLRTVESFVDVTLVCEGQNIKAHKIVMSVGSNVFRKILLSHPAQHPVIILQDMKYFVLRTVIDFLYKGEVSVSENELKYLLKAASTLEINVLRDICKEKLNNIKNDCEQNSRNNWRSKSPPMSSKKKRSRKLSIDSDVYIENVLPKTEIPDSPVTSGSVEPSLQMETLPCLVNIDPDEFAPQIAFTKTVNDNSSEAFTNWESASEASFCQSTGKKDASTEYDIQPLQELKSNVIPEQDETVPCSKPNPSAESEESASGTKGIVEVNKGQRKRSVVWQFFTEINSRYAACRICNSKLSYRTSVTNLLKHIINKHKSFDVKNPPRLPEVPVLNLQDQNREEIKEVEMDLTDKEEEQHDEDSYLTENETNNKTVMCLKPEASGQSEEFATDAGPEEDRKRRKRSLIWKFYTMVEDPYALCRICRNKISFKTSITNLTKHVLKRHPRYDIKNPPTLPDVTSYDDMDFPEEDDDDSGSHLTEFFYLENTPCTSTPCILKFDQSN